MFVVRQGGVEALNQSRSTRQVKIHQVGTARLGFIVIQIDFHAAALLRECRTAIGSLELDAVVARSIMRCSNHDTGNGVHIFDCMRNCRGGSIRLRQIHGKSIGSQHPCDFLGVPVGKETGIKPNHNPVRIDG